MYLGFQSKGGWVFQTYTQILVEYPPPLGITMDKERNYLKAGLRERL